MSQQTPDPTTGPELPKGMDLMNALPGKGGKPGKTPLLTTPLSAQGFPRWLIFIAAALGLIYILNPTAGILELIPDNFPIIGNLDDALAFMLVWVGIVEIFEGKNFQKPKP